MLNRIISYSLRNRAFVLVAALGVAVYGSAVATKLPIDVLPDLDRPKVTIMTEAHSRYHRSARASAFGRCHT